MFVALAKVRAEALRVRSSPDDESPIADLLSAARDLLRSGRRLNQITTRTASHAYGLSLATCPLPLRSSHRLSVPLHASLVRWNPNP